MARPKKNIEQSEAQFVEGEAQSVEDEYADGYAIALKRHSGEGLYRAGIHFPKGTTKRFKSGELSVSQLDLLIAEQKLEITHL